MYKLILTWYGEDHNALSTNRLEDIIPQLEEFYSRCMTSYYGSTPTAMQIKYLLDRAIANHDRIPMRVEWDT